MQIKKVSLMSFVVASAFSLSVTAQELTPPEAPVLTEELVVLPPAELELPAVTPESVVAEPVVSAPATAPDEALPAELEERRQQLEQELRDTSLTDKTALDYSNRAGLGEFELTTLPGLAETQIDGPLPMTQSVSKNDLPSEQLLGRINSEVFHEMADLERGNTFLKLQTQKEQLKNELEKLKATYRQNRLEEISKREEVVRQRIKWWQEQEDARLALEQQRAEEAALEAEIAEQEALRDQLRDDAIQRKTGGALVADEENGKAVVAVLEPFSSLYSLMSIRGLSGDLSAQLQDTESEEIVIVKKDDILPSGYVVKNVTKDSVFVAYGNQEDFLTLPVVQ